MNLVELKCKHCGGVMKVNSELNEILCNFCGSKILIQDEATEINRIENAKLNARIKNHEQDLKEAEDKKRLEEELEDKKSRKKTSKISIVFTIIVLLMTIVGFKDNHIMSGLISAVQTIFFIISILLSNGIIKEIFKKDYKILFWLGILLSILWLANA